MRTELDFRVRGSSCLDPVHMGAALGGGVFSSWLHLETVSLGRDFSTLLGRVWLLSGEHTILEADRNVGQENWLLSLDLVLFLLPKSEHPWGRDSVLSLAHWVLQDFSCKKKIIVITVFAHRLFWEMSAVLVVPSWEWITEEVVYKITKLFFFSVKIKMSSEETVILATFWDLEITYLWRGFHYSGMCSSRI